MAVVSNIYIIFMPKKANTTYFKTCNPPIFNFLLTLTFNIHNVNVNNNATKHLINAISVLDKPCSIRILLNIPIQELQKAANNAYIIPFILPYLCIQCIEL